MSDKVWTVAEILNTTAAFLGKKDPRCPRLEAELLLSVVLDLQRVQLYINFERILTEPEISSYRELVRRRAGHEPVAYILGKREFYGLSLKVTRDTLIPRPETEHLVDEAIRIVKGPAAIDDGPDEAPDGGVKYGPEDGSDYNAEYDLDDGSDDLEPEEDSAAPGVGAGAPETGAAAKRPAPAQTPAALRTGPKPDRKAARRDDSAGRAVTAADIGCGSGAIAVALAKSLPNLTVKAVDLSPEALEVAKENAKTHQVDDRITFFAGNLLEPLAGERFDLVCANLPYVPDADMAALPPDVARYEPRQALAGGPEGLDLIAELIAQAPSALVPGGHLLLEIWPDSLAKATELVKRAGLTPLEPVQDLSKRNRVLVARA